MQVLTFPIKTRIKGYPLAPSPKCDCENSRAQADLALFCLCILRVKDPVLFNFQWQCMYIIAQIVGSDKEHMSIRGGRQNSQET